MTFMIWNWWSVYLSGELKSASNRNRQLSIMFGALSWNVVGLVVGVLLLFKVDRLPVHRRRQHGAERRHTCCRSGPFYHFFAALVGQQQPC